MAASAVVDNEGGRHETAPSVWSRLRPGRVCTCQTPRGADGLAVAAAVAVAGLTVRLAADPAPGESESAAVAPSAAATSMARLRQRLQRGINLASRSPTAGAARQRNPAT
jgi:hypothetical protein